jgi:hypothetical protein
VLSIYRTKIFELWAYNFAKSSLALQTGRHVWLGHCAETLEERKPCRWTDSHKRTKNLQTDYYTTICSWPESERSYSTASTAREDKVAEAWREYWSYMYIVPNSKCVSSKGFCLYKIWPLAAGQILPSGRSQTNRSENLPASRSRNHLAYFHATTQFTATLSVVLHRIQQKKRLPSCRVNSLMLHQ